ncbi:MAG: hypothetical protein WDO17_02515 [Alphaproteobacteria bacterium]
MLLVMWPGLLWWLVEPPPERWPVPPQRVLLAARLSRVALSRADLQAVRAIAPALRAAFRAVLSASMTSVPSRRYRVPLVPRARSA